MSVKKWIQDGLKSKAKKTVLDPINQVVDQNVSDIVTTIGSFAARYVRGKFQRSITFTIGSRYSDRWMEEALYGILYKYNDIRAGSQLELTNKRGVNDGSAMYYQLDVGTHSLKYRKWDILLCIQTSTASIPGSRMPPDRIYTVITYDMSPEFCKYFERDMLEHRNALLKIRSDATTVNVFRDYHESDGYTIWDKALTIPKRRIGTVYMEPEKKRKLVDTLNEFFANKAFYNEHGISHNLKILLYGPPGPQPVSCRIPTPNGYRKFGDIIPGELVFDADGKPTVVEEIYEYKDLEVCELRFEDQQTVHCSIEHKFPVFTDPTSDQFVEMSVDDLLKADSLWNEDGSCRYYVRIGEPTDCSAGAPSKIFMDEAYTFGMGVAMQSVCQTASHSLMREIEHIYHWNRSARIMFLNGFIAGYTRLCTIMGEPLVVPRREDGFTEFRTHSYAISDALCDICRQTGVRTKQDGIELLIDLNSNPNLLEFEMFTALKPDHIKNYRMVGLKAIWVMPKRENMRCLHVASPTHQYITEDFIVTCNTGKDSIAKMIASEWNRNMYYVTGGKGGKFVPNAITDVSDDVTYPLIIISDIDKYPFLINEPSGDVTDKDTKDEAIQYKQTFGAMINALDGLLSGEDRIVIMTTNHIEKFSETFLRPGRIDLMMEIGYVTPPVFRQFVWDFYHAEIPGTFKMREENTTIASMQFDMRFSKMSLEEFLKKYTK